MLEHKKIQSLGDYFVDLNSRQNKGVYFYRINGYSEEISEFIKKYYDVARRTGVVIEGKIPNPDEKNLAYYGEIMGMNFQMSMEFISTSLKKWLPRMNDFQRQNVSASIYDSLDTMRKAGKTENMLKNAYIKFMCWLYYKFERIVNQLGENNIPKILYEGNVSNYELMLISILSNAGCDVVMLQYQGDQGYLKVDPNSVLSDNLQMSGLQSFPEGFSLKKVREELQNEINALKDKNMRIAAEMVNTLRRKDEETNRLLKYSNESLITELLPVIDNFERALNVDATSNDIESYQKGMTMIYNSLKNILEKFEVKEIEAIDKEFDPSFHQAVMQEEKEGTKENIVIEVLQKGYTYKDKVIRPAMVKVSK